MGDILDLMLVEEKLVEISFKLYKKNSKKNLWRNRPGKVEYVLLESR
jgi:hypothetical protein